MATLVRCIEGHAFDMAASETCPTCGSAVGKNKSVKEPVYENKSPLDRTKIIELAVVTVSIIFSLAVIFAIALGIRQLMPEGGIKSVVHDAWARLEASWERTHRLPRSPSGTGEEPRNSFSKEMEKRNLLKKFGAGDKPDKLPNPFAPPKPQNPFDPKPGNPFDPKIRFSVDPK
jgi:hypothetical protein